MKVQQWRDSVYSVPETEKGFYVPDELWERFVRTRFEYRTIAPLWVTPMPNRGNPFFYRCLDVFGTYHQLLKEVIACRTNGKE